MFGPLTALAVLVAQSVYSPPAGPNVNFTLHVGGTPVKLPKEEAARKAVAGMAKLGFAYAGLDRDGHAWGYTRTVTAVVLVFPLPDGQTVPMVCAAGWDNPEAERVRNELRTFLTDAPHDPTAPPQAGVLLPQAFRKAPPLRWQTDARPGLAILAKYFVPAAALSLEKVGMGPVPQGPNMVMGSGSGRVTALFCVPGPNALTGVVAAVTTSPDPDVADRGCRLAIAEVVKILFE